MSVLEALQKSVERLHDIDTELDVCAYVVDPELRSGLPGAREGLPEQLFVREVDGDVEMALYVDPEIVAGLERDDPHTNLHAGNLASYCVALEGVSHFVFVAYRARLGRPVTALELELQAEVDKFVNAWLLLTAQGACPQRAARQLSRSLFDNYVLRDEVPAEEKNRYRIATRAAARFCHGLVDRYGRDKGPRRIERAVRSHYRQGLAEKIRAA